MVAQADSATSNEGRTGLECALVTSLEAQWLITATELHSRTNRGLGLASMHCPLPQHVSVEKQMQGTRCYLGSGESQAKKVRQIEREHWKMLRGPQPGIRLTPSSTV